MLTVTYFSGAKNSAILLHSFQFFLSLSLTHTQAKHLPRRVDYAFTRKEYISALSTDLRDLLEKFHFSFLFNSDEVFIFSL